MFPLCSFIISSIWESILGSHEVKLAIKGQLTATKKTARTQGQRKCGEDFPKMCF